MLLSFDFICSILSASIDISCVDEKIAIRWLERSAQKAYPPALQQLASMYYYGIGTVKNDVKAYEYYLLAKQLGVTDVELDMNMST